MQQHSQNSQHSTAQQSTAKHSIVLVSDSQTLASASHVQQYSDFPLPTLQGRAQLWCCSGKALRMEAPMAGGPGVSRSLLVLFTLRRGTRAVAAPQAKAIAPKPASCSCNGPSLEEQVVICSRCCCLLSILLQAVVVLDERVVRNPPFRQPHFAALACHSMHGTSSDSFAW